MGRKRRKVQKDSNEPMAQKHVSNPRKDIEKRLGHNDQVCCSCNVRNADTASKCRKCGSTDLRPKATQYSDE